MTIGSLERSGCCSLACFLALACGPTVDSGDSDSAASTSMLETSTSMLETSTSMLETSTSMLETSTSTLGSTTDDASSDPTAVESSSSGGVEGCDPFPVEDTACSVEGQSCSTDCSDQCQFCNVLTCETGVWSRTEVFPAPCLDCGPLCDLVVPAGCTGGPPDTQTCIAGCEQALTGECAAEFSDTRACAGSEPAFICSDETRPEVAGCEEQYDALYACMGI